MRKLYLMLVALLACGALAAGCGGGDDNGDGGSSGSSGSSGSNSSSGSSNPNVKQAVANCKQSVDSAQGLKSDTKAELKDLCDKAGKGDENGVRKASRDVCVKIVEDTVPSGPTRDQAVDACKQGTGQ
jgi:hypothetical protein